MDSSLTLQQVLTRRKYSVPKGYSNWDCIYKRLRRAFNGVSLDNVTLAKLQRAAFRIEEMRNNGSIEHLHAELLTAVYQSAWILFESPPVYLLKEDLFNAFHCSRLPKNPIVSHLFAEVGVILYPRNNQLSIDYITFCAADDYIKCHCFLGDGKVGTVNIPLRTILTEVDGGVVTDRTSTNLKQKMNTLKHSVTQIFLYKQLFPSEDLSYEQQARHGLIVPDRKRAVSGYNPKKLSPIIIGENYRIKRERVEATGTHASPQTHWRSGHWRQQPIGKRENPEYKTIWIEPVLVNG